MTVLFCANCGCPFWWVHKCGASFCAECNLPEDIESYEAALAWEAETGLTVYTHKSIEGTQIAGNTE